MIGLVLDPPAARGLRKGPANPSLILGCRMHGFGSLAQLATRIHELRDGRAIQLTPGVAAFDGSDTFPIFKLWTLDPEGEDRRFLAAVAVQGDARERLEAAIADANPDAPRAVKPRRAA